MMQQHAAQDSIVLTAARMHDTDDSNSHDESVLQQTDLISG